MNFEYTLKINRTAREVYAFMQDADNLKKWLANFVKLEHISGTPGRPGAVSKHYYNEGGREIVMKEVITDNIENKVFAGTLTFMGITMYLKNEYEDHGDGTMTLHACTDMQTSNLFLKLFNWLNKRGIQKRYEEDFQRLKTLLESGE